MKHLQELLNKNGATLTVDGIIGKQTIAALQKYLEAEHKRLGYDWFADNIIGLRFGNSYTNSFSDVGVVIKNGNVALVIPFTTVPGRYYVYNPLTVGGITGCAVLAPGQYKRSHTFVENYSNKWRSPYFEHIGIMKVYRDGNKNDIVDTNVLTDSPPSHGIFLHQMGTVFGNIWNWSAGCNGAMWADWLKVCAFFRHGQVINYTLLKV